MQALYDHVAQAATIISYCHRARFSPDGSMESVALKLKTLREAAAPRMTVRALAAALGMPPSTYAAYEDPKKFKKPILPFDLAKRIAQILAERGVDKSKVMQLAGLDKIEAQPPPPPPASPAKVLLQVIGVVEAGVWREQSDWPEDERYWIEVGPSPVPGERFALRMQGHSMDRTIPPGSDLECLRVPFGSTLHKPGHLVIVERTAHDLTELTCKRLAVEGDQWVLRCESTKPEFQDDIPIGKPDENSHNDIEIRVIGIVLKSHQDHFKL